MKSLSSREDLIGVQGRFDAPGAGERLEHDALVRWAEFNAQQIFEIDVRVLSDEMFHVHCDTASTINTRVIHLVSNAHVIERSSELIRRNPTDGILIGMVLRGRVNVIRDGDVASLVGGELFIVTPDRPFMSVIDRDTEIVGVLVSWRLYSQASSGLGSEHPSRILIDANPFASALRDRVLATGHNPAGLTDKFVIEMVHGMLSSTEPDAGDHLQSARRYIDANLDDPALSAKRIAAAISISERHLSRVFADAGQSVPVYVRVSRLERAMDLISSADSSITVSDIARDCGFSSASHFSRSFSRHFATHPSDALRRRSAQRSSG